MKHASIYWIIFASVFVFSMVVFCSYWRATKENPLSVVFEGVVNNLNLGNSKHYIKNGDGSQSDILVPENSETPTVFARADLVNYFFVENQQTGEDELYVKLLIEEKILPIRVDSFSVSGKGQGLNFIVKKVNQDQKDYIISSLEESKAKSPSVLNNYIILTSINTLQQKELCVSFYGSDLGEQWCKFNPSEKSFSKKELLEILKKSLKKNDQEVNKNIMLSEYLNLKGNVLIVIQVNYFSEAQINR